MKCPRMVVTDWKLGLKPQFAMGDCLKEECAWWDKEHEICGELTKSKALWTIRGTLLLIAEKMPYKVEL